MSGCDMVITVWVDVVGLTCGAGLLWVATRREGGTMPGWRRVGVSSCPRLRSEVGEAGWVVCMPYAASGVYTSVLVVGSGIL